MQSKPKFSTSKNAKTHRIKDFLHETPDDLDVIADHQSMISQDVVVDGIAGDGLASQPTEPELYAANTATATATDAGTQGVSAATNAGAAPMQVASVFPAAAPSQAAHVLSAAIPAASEIGLGYSVASAGMGLLGWAATIGGGAGVAAAAGGGSKGGSSATAPTYSTVPAGTPAATILAGTDTTIDATEVGTATVLTVTPAVGQQVNSVSVSGIGKTTGTNAMGIANYTTQLTRVGQTDSWTFDATQFQDGTLTVSAYSSAFGSGGVNPTVTTNLTLVASAVTAGGDAFLKATEATSAATLTLLLTAGDTATGNVTVSGTDKTTGAAKTAVAILAVAGTVTFDATGFSDGVLTVSYTTAQHPAGMTGAVTLDTVAPAVPNSVSSGGWPYPQIIHLPDVSATTSIVVAFTTTVATETLSSVSVTGVDKTTNLALTVNATQSNSSDSLHWTFDATQFADGTLTVNTVTTDAAGNTSSGTNNLTLNTGIVATQNANGLYVQNQTSSWLNVYPSAGETVNSITVSGLNSAGGTISRNAMQTSGTWNFDATVFADGNLSVVVTTSTGVQPAVTLIKDSVAPAAATVLAGTDTVVDLLEISTATALMITPAAAGDKIQSVTVSGYDKTITANTTTSTSATKDASGNWVFDATIFKDGVLNVSTTVADVAGNTNYGMQTTALTLNSSPALAGGDAYIKATETTAATTLTLLLGAGDAVTGSVTVSGADKITGTAKTTVATLGAAGTATFDATGFGDGVLTVSYTTVKHPAGVAGMVTLDTVAPAVPNSVSFGSWWTNVQIIHLPDVSATTPLVLSMSGGASDTVVSASVTGVDKTTNLALTVNATQVPIWSDGLHWTFDATKFADGTLTVNTVTADAAGNTAAGTNTLTLDTSLVNSGGDHFVNSGEYYTTSWLTVYSPNTDPVNSVTITGNNAANVQISRTATASGTSYTFDATAFADGNLSVVVQTRASSGVLTNHAAVTLVKDTVAPGAATVLAGTDAAISRPEISTVTALTVTPAVGSAITQVQVAGTDLNNVWHNSDAVKNAITGNWEFDATIFRAGALSVYTYSTDAAGNTASTYSTMQLVSGPTVDQAQFAALTPVNLAKGGATTSIDTGLLFLNETSVSVTSNSASFTAAISAGMLTITSTATTGYGSVTLAATDASGNTTSTDFQVAVTGAVGVVTVGGVTAASAGSTLYDAGTGASNETFNISTSTASVFKGGDGADTFVLNTSYGPWAQIVGGSDTALDVLRLTANWNSVSLGYFNYANGQVINDIELIDMATHTGADSVSLTARDLFVMHSSQTDALTGVMALTINGGANDTVNFNATDGTALTLSGSANSFTATGDVGAGYSKYTGTYIDSSGSHLTEVLLQNGVIVM